MGNASERRTVPLREISERIDYGYTASAKAEEIGPKLLRITDIVPDLIDWTSVPHCSISAQNHERYRLNSGDIVIARTGATSGYAKRIRHHPDAVFASYLVRLRINPQHDSGYVGFIVESEEYKRFIRANMTGSAQPQANAKVLTSFPIQLPPLPTQRRIASILSAYDDLIENNTRRIAILEEMARLVYREWFVHYRFPGHEGVPMVDSPLGLIPEGWEARRLESFGKIVTGKTPSKAEPKYYGDFIPFVKIADMRERVFCIDTEERLSQLGALSQSNKTLRANSICVSCIGSAGIVSITSEPSQTNQQINSINLSAGADREFLYFALKDLESLINLYGATGATMVNLSRGKFASLEVVYPNEEIRDDFHNMTFPLFEQVRTLQLKNRNLRRTRDLLLPRLVSGEVEVERMEIIRDGDVQ